TAAGTSTASERARRSAPHRHRCGAFVLPIGVSVGLRACTRVETLKRSSCSSARGFRGIIKAQSVSTKRSEGDEWGDRTQETRGAGCGDGQAAGRAGGEGDRCRRACGG